MEFHCNSIVSIIMPPGEESPQFSISLPTEAIEEIENGLIPFGLYGKKRALRVHAVRFKEKDQAQKVVDENAANNPGTEWRVVEI